MKCNDFRETLLQFINSWEDGSFSDLQFYRESNLLFEDISKYCLTRRLEKAEHQGARNLLGAHYYFQNIPYDFEDKSIIPFLRRRIKSNITKAEEASLLKKYYPVSNLKKQSEKLKDQPFYAPFYDLLKNTNCSQYIEDELCFNRSMGSAVSYSRAASNKPHPGGEISWIDTLHTIEHKNQLPHYECKGICYAGSTSGGLELNIPFLLKLNLKLKTVSLNFGDLLPNSEESRKQIKSSYKTYYSVPLKSEDFFKLLESNYYGCLAKKIASKLINSESS